MGIRIGLMAAGVVLIVFSFRTHCAKRLSVDYAVAWSLLGALLIVLGAVVVPALSAWTRELGTAAKWGLFCVCILLVSTGMHESMVISQLTSKNQELAMQVAMLNQENETIKAEVERLAEVQGETDAEKALIYR